MAKKNTGMYEVPIENNTKEPSTQKNNSDEKITSKPETKNNANTSKTISKPKETQKPISKTSDAPKPEAELKNAPKPEAGNMPKPNIGYKYVGYDSRKNKSSRRWKKILIPDEKIANGFIIIFIGIFIVAAMNFPFSSFMSGNLDAMASIGYPFTIAEFKLTGQDPTFYIGNTIKDLLIYFILAYSINIIFNLLSKVTFFEKRAETEQRPAIFKDQIITTTEKLAEKITGES